MFVLISVNPPYTDMIFNGYKPFEFRKKVLRGMDTGYPTEEITAYIYETKNKGGVGAVVGEVKIDGAYTPDYARDPESTSKLVRERYMLVKSMYLMWCEMKGIKPNMNEGWFKSKEFMAYQREIGFIGKDDSLNFNYALLLNEPQKYTHPKPLSCFKNLDGAVLSRPPQNMQRVKEMNI